MKFLMTAYQIQDWGGIINHVEHLAAGLKELGHEVEFVLLVPRKKVGATRAPDSLEEWRTLGTGHWFNQQKGWSGVRRIPYVGSDNRSSFLEYCSRFDACLWHIPVPTLAGDNEGILDWVSLYGSGTPNYAILHDGNCPRLYPHLHEVEKKFAGLICVHESAYGSAAGIAIPRVMIPNPFEITDPGPDWTNRNGFVSIHVWKGWKRMDTLIRAIPHMKNTERRIVGGGGIEQRYMTSRDKVKEKYFTKDRTRIWDEAAERMCYVGFVPNDEVLRYLRSARLQIDPSWSNRYAKYGAHWNRTTIESMICGAVPMATDLCMKDSGFFEKNVNYLEIPHLASPQEFANIVDRGLSDQTLWTDIRENNKFLLDMFDRKKVAQRYVDLIKNPLSATVYQTSSDIIAASKKNMEFFGG